MRDERTDALLRESMRAGYRLISFGLVIVVFGVVAVVYTAPFGVSLTLGFLAGIHCYITVRHVRYVRRLHKQVREKLWR